MYGYIRPLRSELKIRQDELYKAAYCGLCRELARSYGFAARFAVNYDMTFYLLLAGREGCGIRSHRCPAHPLRKRPCLVCSDETERAAAYTIILAWHKLRDKLEDDGVFARLGARMGCLLLRRAYRKARAREAAFAAYTEKRLAELSELEKEHSPESDRCADCFASILAKMSAAEPDEGQRRALHEILYHVGRSIYLLDALDDLEDDVKNESYNPLRYRYGEELSAEEREELRGDLNLSQRRAALALALTERTSSREICDNILCLGLPYVTDRVFAGEWGSKQKRQDQERKI